MPSKIHIRNPSSHARISNTEFNQENNIKLVFLWIPIHPLVMHGSLAIATIKLKYESMLYMNITLKKIDLEQNGES
jgi:hypothetical protein